MRVSIEGIGCVNGNCFGSGPNCRHYRSLDMPVSEFSGKDVFDEAYPRFGRMDEYSRMGLAAMAFALKDAGKYEWNEKRNIGLIVSTVYGCLTTDIDYHETARIDGGSQASPGLFAFTLPNTFLGEASIRFGLIGPAFAINRVEPEDVFGLHLAIVSILSGEAEGYLFGICDAKRPACFPEEMSSNPGALFFLLERSSEPHSGRYGNLTCGSGEDVFLDKLKVERIGNLLDGCFQAMEK